MRRQYSNRSESIVCDRTQSARTSIYFMLSKIHTALLHHKELVSHDAAGSHRLSGFVSLATGK